MFNNIQRNTNRTIMLQFVLLALTLTIKAEQHRYTCRYITYITNTGIDIDAKKDNSYITAIENDLCECNSLNIHTEHCMCKRTNQKNDNTTQTTTYYVQQNLGEFSQEDYQTQYENIVKSLQQSRDDKEQFLMYGQLFICWVMSMTSIIAIIFFSDRDSKTRSDKFEWYMLISNVAVTLLSYCVYVEVTSRNEHVHIMDSNGCSLLGL